MKSAMTVVSAGVVILVVSAGVVFAADCGGTGATAVLCSCGDTVTADRTLSTDPVTSTGPGDFCPADGLTVASGVSLHLGSKVIRGAGSGAGGRGLIVLSGASVDNGKVREFGIGVLVSGPGATVLAITAKPDNGVGISVDAGSALVKDNIVQNNIGDGIFLSDNAPTTVLQTNNVQNNGGIGIDLATVSGATVRKNSIRFNGSHGIQALAGGVCPAPVSGSHTFVENNSSDNGGNNFDVTAAGNSFIRNTANRSGSGSGIEVGSGGNAFVENSTSNNAANGLDAPDVTNTDGGGNHGSANGGIQCEIAGAPCI